MKKLELKKETIEELNSEKLEELNTDVLNQVQGGVQDDTAFRDKKAKEGDLTEYPTCSW